MRRLWFPFLIALLLAACSSTPQRTSRGGHAYRTQDARNFPSRPPGLPEFVDHSIGREEISIQAMSLVGVPYRWGGNTPASGFDCSGFVRYVMQRAASVNLPRTTAQMSHSGEAISPDEIASGDLVFFNTDGGPHSHVGIYVGKLRFINAPSTGGTVRLDYLTNPYWAKHFDGIRRVAPPKRAPSLFDAPTYEASNTVVEPAAATTATTAAGVTAAPRSIASASPSPAAEVRQADTAANHPAIAMSPRVAEAASMEPERLPPPVAAQTLTPQPAPAGDAFEPPPPSLSAAQRQAREADAVTPQLVAAPAPDVPAASPTTTANHPASFANAPDPIDAAADAYEPPPPATMARDQARAARQENPVGIGTVQTLRASTASSATPAPTQTRDDPIARFANGN